jgi:hypothetical protein
LAAEENKQSDKVEEQERYLYFPFFPRWAYVSSRYFEGEET